MKRIVILSGLLILVAMLLSGCGANSSGTTQTSTQDTQTTDNQGTTMKVYTVDELARFNGQDGNPAYVAVDGVVYDLSGSSLWPQGQHTSCDLNAMAGKDLSEVIEQAPARMRDNLKRFPVVGQLAP